MAAPSRGPAALLGGPGAERPVRQSDGVFLGVAEQNRQRHLKIHLLLAASA